MCPLTSATLFQNQPASTLGSALLRCDKLDQAEIRSLLMCFLHVLKSMSEGKVVPLWAVPHLAMLSFRGLGV